MRATIGSKLTRDTLWEDEGSAKSVRGRESRKKVVFRWLREGTGTVKCRRGPVSVGLFASVVQGQRCKIESKKSEYELKR